MKLLYNIILVVLVFLAVSSGVTKIMLMQQDVDFFAQYGFTNPILIAFGASQLLGGILLALPKTRIIGDYCCNHVYNICRSTCTRWKYTSCYCNSNFCTIIRPYYQAISYQNYTTANNEVAVVKRRIKKRTKQHWFSSHT